MKVVLVGLVSNHHSMYLALLNRFEVQECPITFITTDKNKEVYKDLNSELIDFHFESGATAEVLKQQKAFIDSFEVLIIDELFDGFKDTWSLQFKTKRKITFLHNVNRVFYPLKPKGMKAKVRRVLLNRYFSQFDEFVVVAPNVKDYLSTFVQKDKVFVVPFNSGFVEQKIKSKSEVILTVPGMVDSNRRDYKSVLNVFEAYLKRNQKSQIKLNLLGRLKEKHIKDHCDKINSQFEGKVLYYEKFIPDEQFEEQLQASDFVLSNLEVFTTKQDSLEIYGLTKESGIAFILFKYALPGIVPYNQVLFGEMNEQVLFFEKLQELETVFRRIDEQGEDLNALRYKAKENQIGLNKEFEKSMDDLIESITSNG